MTLGEEEIAFLFAMGDALTQWSYAENQLSLTACLAAPPATRGTLKIAIFQVENFRSRLALCDALMQGALKDKALVAEWNRIHKDLTSLSSSRNKIAHRKTVLYVAGEVGRRWALESWDNADKRPNERPSTTAICVQQLVRFRQQFHKATRDLASLQHRISTGVGLPAAFEVQVQDLPEIRAIRNQIRGALGLRRLPRRT